MKLISMKIGDSQTKLYLPGAKDKNIVEAKADARIFWLIDAAVAKLHSRSIASLVAQNASVGRPLLLPVSERIKSNHILQRIYGECSVRGLKRTDMIGVIGGGALSDLGGFVAATWIRGIPWVVVPTTLLAMVDAAIGGKTGINLASGKNQIGAIWQPDEILVDTSFLSTLPLAEFRSGMGEVVKYAGLIGNPLLKEVQKCILEDKNYEGVHSELPLRIVERCIRYKVDIVQRDPREKGERIFLNLGHTIGHGIETALGYGKLRHGEAVLIGLAAANRLALLSSKAKGVDLEPFDELVIQVSQSIRMPKLSLVDILKGMESDKKRTASGLRFLLLRRPGEAIIFEKVPKLIVKEALRMAIEDIKEGRVITS